MNYIPPPNKQLYYEQVWALVRQIPFGSVATYGQIANKLPVPDDVSIDAYQTSASRWVGLAMSACPDDVPWHRVVNSQGKISHPEAGKQKKLLEGEGIVFSNDKLDLTKYQWLLSDESTRPEQGQLF